MKEKNGPKKKNKDDLHFWGHSLSAFIRIHILVYEDDLCLQTSPSTGYARAGTQKSHKYMFFCAKNPKYALHCAQRALTQHWTNIFAVFACQIYSKNCKFNYECTLDEWPSVIAYPSSRHPNVWPTIALSNLNPIQLKLYPRCRTNARDLNAVLTFAVRGPWTPWSSSYPFGLFYCFSVVGDYMPPP